MLITRFFFCAFQTNQRHNPHHFLCAGWLLSRKEQTDGENIYCFLQAIGWITFVSYHLGLRSSNTETFNIKMPRVITFTIYCNSANLLPAVYLFYSYVYLIKFCSHCMTHIPYRVVPHNLIMYCVRDHMHCPQWVVVGRPLFLRSPVLRRTHLIAVTASQYASVPVPLLYSFKTSPAVIVSSSSNNREHKGRLRWTQVHVKAAGLRPPTTLLSLDVIVSTGGRPPRFKARMGSTQSLCPRCHSLRQPNLAARWDWKPGLSQDPSVFLIRWQSQTTGSFSY